MAETSAHSSPERSAARGVWMPWGGAPLTPTLAVLTFAAYAACFLYFFVDDEAIPLVYAQNVLRGNGFSYNVLEGRVEGYSDFLHVIWNACLLGLLHVLGVPKLSVIDVGSAVSFGFGIGIILLTARAIQRTSGSSAAAAAGLAFLALAGPLALWSCSSLETARFSFVITALGWALFCEPANMRAVVPVVLAALVLLERIDGFVYVGVLLVGAIAVADRPRRQWLLRRILVPCAAVAAAYHGARFIYFGTLLSAPLSAKVLYKLSPPQHVIVKAPDRGYLRTFVDLYGIAIVPALGVAGVSAWRSRPARGAIVAGILMGAYASVVGDWMFGWRFLVPLLPLVAFVIATAVSRLRGRLAWMAAAVIVAWSAVGARAFASEFVRTQNRPIWWREPHRGDTVGLASDDDLIAIARRAVTRGETIAYNQAGLLAFVLDVENIDDLGICSKFEAELPTTDVYFTEVGRYSPLTDAPVFNAAHAYLLYRDARMLISRTDLLTKANGGHVPAELLDGYFRLRNVDASGENALYVRTEKNADAYRRDPSLFRENLAHTSRLRRVEIDGAALSDDLIGPSLPFLRWQTGTISVRGTSRADIRFADHDEDVYAIYAGSLSASGPVAVTLNLYGEAGRLVASEDAQADESPAPLLRRFDGPVRARLLSIEARAAGNAEARLTISDLRVHGQSAVLRDYVRRKLKFSVP